MASDMCFTVVELTLSGDLDKFRNYFYNWCLELNTNKTVFSAFHLTVCLAGYGLNITTMGERVPFKKNTKISRCHSWLYTFLPPTFTKHRSNLLNKHASNHWGADFTTLRSSTLALCVFCCQICCPIWCQSHHCKKLNTSLNECLILVSICIKYTPIELLPILSVIKPSDIRRNKNILILGYVLWKTLTFFTRLQYLHLKMEESKAECHYQLVCTI